MKIVILSLSLVGLFAGCATNDNGMGGSGEQYSSEQNVSYDSTARYHSNAVNGTGTATATNGMEPAYNQGNTH